MKINKNLVFVLFLIVFAFSSTFISAKNEKSNSAIQTKPVSATTKYLNQTIQKIETIKPKVKTPAVKQELEQIQTEQVKSDKIINDSLNKISTRSGLAKLVIGPDYKNAGAVRSEIVHLQNQIRQLTRLENKASTSEKPVINDSISSLNQELLAIETRLMDSLKGFSLFGWLNKLLTGFVPSTTPSVIPTVEPTVIPTVTPVIIP